MEARDDDASPGSPAAERFLANAEHVGDDVLANAERSEASQKAPRERFRRATNALVRAPNPLPRALDDAPGKRLCPHRTLSATSVPVDGPDEGIVAPCGYSVEPQATTGNQ